MKDRDIENGLGKNRVDSRPPALLTPVQVSIDGELQA